MLDMQELANSLNAFVNYFEQIKKQNISKDETKELLQQVIDGVKEEMDPIKLMIIDFLNDSPNMPEVTKTALDIQMKALEKKQNENMDEMISDIKDANALIQAAGKDIQHELFIPFIKEMIDYMINVMMLFDGSNYKFPLIEYIKQNPNAII